MSATGSAGVTEYLERLRVELVRADAEDADDIVAEVRSLLTDAGGEDGDEVAVAIMRLGEPEDLARGILAERGLDVPQGMSTSVWWRLGVAAPLDILIGLSLPLAVALPITILTRIARPGLGLVLLGVALTAASLAWPFFIWRPWRRGGRPLSPGMVLTGVAVVRSGGSWRLASLRDLPHERRRGLVRLAVATLATLVAAVLLAGTAMAALDIGIYNISSALVRGDAAGKDVMALPPTPQELEAIVGDVYDTAWRGGEATSAYLPSAGISSFGSFRERARAYEIHGGRPGMPVQQRPGLYRFVVKENARVAPPVAASRFTIGRRTWPTDDGRGGADWVVLDIAAGLDEL